MSTWQVVTGRLRPARLGPALGLALLVAAVLHGSRVVESLLLAAGVAVFYLSLRRQDASGAAMSDDLRARERQALEINDNIVQGLARVKWALEARQEEEALRAADETLGEAQRMVTDLLMEQSDGGTLHVARLRREVPAGAIAHSE